jgi:hypothetical protein
MSVPAGKTFSHREITAVAGAIVRGLNVSAAQPLMTVPNRQQCRRGKPSDRRDLRMTGMAFAGRRLNAAMVLAAMMLITAGLVIGFALAQIVSVGNLSGTDVQNRAPVGIRAPGQFGGLSPDDRQALRGTGQASSGQSSARFGGLSPDDRDDLPPAP